MYQNTCNARDIEKNDLVIFGTQLYRVHEIKNVDGNTTELKIVTEQRVGSSSWRTIELQLSSDHIVTVMRTD